MRIDKRQISAFEEFLWKEERPELQLGNRSEPK